MSSDNRSTARKLPNFFPTASMRSKGMSAAVASGADFAGSATTSLRGPDVDNSSAMFPAGPIVAAR
jgi:hypothetical protein